MERLAELLATLAQQGRLEVENPTLAARQLAELCKVGLFQDVLFNLKRDPAEDEAEAEAAAAADGAVTTFLKAYGKV